MQRQRAPGPPSARPGVLALLTGLAILALASYCITRGTWTFFLPTGWSGPRFVFFYDEQGRSLLEGRWDVPDYAIKGEAIVVDGKRYGYFGFVPAIPRIALNWLAPTRFGQWSRWSMILALAAVIAAFFAFLPLLDTHLPWQPLLLIALICGTTAIFLNASDLLYHEAVAWGVALAICAYTWFAWYLKTGRILFLWLGSLAALAAFFTRYTSGGAPMLCALLMLFPLIRRRAVSHALVLVSCLAIGAAGYVAINHAKFGTWLDAQPIEHSVQFTPDRLARLQNRHLHPEYMPRIAATYLNPANVTLTARFPFLGMTRETNTGSIPLSGVEPYASIPAAMPAAFALALAGVVLLFRPQGRPFRWCAPILLSAPCTLPVVCCVSYFSYRYLHDVFPFLFFAGILGAVYLTQLRPPLRTAILVLLTLATIWSVWANIAFVYELQRIPLFAA